MSQSCACYLFLAKTNEKDACFRVPQSSSLPQSYAKEKSSGVEIDQSLPLDRYVVFDPPPLKEWKHDLECILGGLVTKQVRGDICNKKLSSYSD